MDHPKMKKLIQKVNSGKIWTWGAEADKGKIYIGRDYNGRIGRKKNKYETVIGIPNKQ